MVCDLLLDISLGILTYPWIGSHVQRIQFGWLFWEAYFGKALRGCLNHHLVLIELYIVLYSHFILHRATKYNQTICSLAVLYFLDSPIWGLSIEALNMSIWTVVIYYLLLELALSLSDVLVCRPLRGEVLTKERESPAPRTRWCRQGRRHSDCRWLADDWWAELKRDYQVRRYTWASS